MKFTFILEPCSMISSLDHLSLKTYLVSLSCFFIFKYSHTLLHLSDHGKYSHKVFQLFLSRVRFLHMISVVIQIILFYSFPCYIFFIECKVSFEHSVGRNTFTLCKCVHKAFEIGIWWITLPLKRYS